MKNKILYIAGAVFICAVGAFLALYWGLNPKPIPKIRLSQFDTAQEVSSAVTLRMRNEILATPVLFLGVWTKDPFSMQVAGALVNEIQNSELKFDAVIVDPTIEVFSKGLATWPEHEATSIDREFDAIAKALARSMGDRRRVLYVLASIHSSQLVDPSPVSLLAQQLQTPFMSISMAPYALNTGEMDSLPYKCKGKLDDRIGDSAFGCAMTYTAQINMRKAQKLSPGKAMALMSQFGMNDYILFLRKP